MDSQTKKQFLGLYAEGWIEGNVDNFLEVADPGYQFGDPQKGSIHRKTFRESFEGFKKGVGQSGETFCEVLLACCTWKTGVNKSIVGNGLIVVGADGVEREDMVLL